MDLYVCIHAWCGSLKSVASKAVLYWGVREDHIRVTEHAQSIQTERLNTKFILQRKNSLWVQTLWHCRQHTADVLRQVGIGVVWERAESWVNTGDVKEQMCKTSLFFFFQLVTWKAGPLISLMESLCNLTDFGLAWPQSDAFLLGHLHKTHSYVGTKHWGLKTLFLTPHTIKTQTVVSGYSKQMQWDSNFFHMYTTTCQ